MYPILRVWEKSSHWYFTSLGARSPNHNSRMRIQVLTIEINKQIIWRRDQGGIRLLPRHLLLYLFSWCFVMCSCFFIFLHLQPSICWLFVQVQLCSLSRGSPLSLSNPSILVPALFAPPITSATLEIVFAAMRKTVCFSILRQSSVELRVRAFCIMTMLQNTSKNYGPWHPELGCRMTLVRLIEVAGPQIKDGSQKIIGWR